MDQNVIKIMVQKLIDQEYIKDPISKFVGKEFLHLIQKWEDLKAEKEELELKFELHKIETQKMQTAAAVIEDISQKVIVRLSEEKHKLSTKLENMEKETRLSTRIEDLLKEKVEQLKEGNKNKTKCLQKVEEENHELSTKLKNMEKEKKGEVADLEEKVAFMLERHKRLCTYLEQLEKCRDMSQELRVKMSKCLQIFKEENHKLSTKLENMEKENRDVAELKKQLERLEKDQKDKTKEFKRQKVTLKDQIDQLKDDLGNKESELESVKKDLHNRTDELEDTANQNKTKHQKEVEDLGSTISTLEGENKALLTETAKVKSRIRELEETIEVSLNDNKKISGSRDSMTKRLEEVQLKLDSSEAALEEKNAKATRLNEEREKKQKDKLMTGQKSQDVSASEKIIQLEGESRANESEFFELKHDFEECNHLSKETETGKVKEGSTLEVKLSKKETEMEPLKNGEIKSSLEREVQQAKPENDIVMDGMTSKAEYGNDNKYENIDPNTQLGFADKIYIEATLDFDEDAPQKCNELATEIFKDLACWSEEDLNNSLENLQILLGQIKPNVEGKYEDLPTKIPIETFHRKYAEIHEKNKDDEIDSIKEILDATIDHPRLKSCFNDDMHSATPPRSGNETQITEALHTVECKGFMDHSRPSIYTGSQFPVLQKNKHDCMSDIDIEKQFRHIQASSQVNGTLFFQLFFLRFHIFQYFVLPFLVLYPCLNLMFHKFLQLSFWVHCIPCPSFPPGFAFIKYGTSFIWVIFFKV